MVHDALHQHIPIRAIATSILLYHEFARDLILHCAGLIEPTHSHVAVQPKPREPQKGTKYHRNKAVAKRAEHTTSLCVAITLHLDAIMLVSCLFILPYVVTLAHGRFRSTCCPERGPLSQSSSSSHTRVHDTCFLSATKQQQSSLST
jgi:hypothetical protein